MTVIADAGEALDGAQLVRALDVARELAELDELRDFPHVSVALLQALMPSEIAAYNALDPASSTVTVIADPPDMLFRGGAELFAELAHQNPLVSHYARTGDGKALRISDFLSAREFRRTDIYDQVYSRIGVEHQLAITLASPRRELGRPDELIGLTLSRERGDFTGAERRLLDIVRPHFTATLGRLHELALLRASVERAGEGSRWLLLVAADGAVAWANTPAAEGLGARTGRRLPPVLADWLAQERARPLDGRSGSSSPAAGTAAPDARQVLIHGGVRLRASLLRDAYPELDAVSLAPLTTAPGAEELRTLGLTKRQAEVMALAIEGHTSAQIARMLFLSPRTVEKHLESVYARLGVENRAQAVASALRAM